MSRIDQLAEQTEFLLEKQRETLVNYAEGFSELYAVLDDIISKSEQTHDAEALERLQNIRSLIETREEELKAQIDEDIAFLEEQFDAIQQIQSLDDDTKEEELTALMLEGKEDSVIDTESFKKELDEEAEDIKDEFMGMIDDMKAALEEGNLDELEAFLEEELIECDDEDEDGECSGSCSGCGTDKMCGKNILEGLEEVEESDSDKDEDEDEEEDDEDLDMDYDDEDEDFDDEDED